jgi:nitrite reductase [NAD(P)H] small subunit
MPELAFSQTCSAIEEVPERVRVALCEIDSLPTGQGRCFSISDLKIAVFRQRDGSVFAIDAACPHRGGPLADGLSGGGIVVCPLHSYRFRLSDGSGVDNDFHVSTYAIEVADGWVFLHLEQPR